MANVLDLLKGKKTYITAILLGIANTGAALGWWDWNHVIMINGILGPLGLAFLRAGIGSAIDPK